uniref:Peptidase S1 domain-containing protein n=1 Tax=Sphaeramia orbicularis TaxID=375764 RepID=A0A672ZGJ4_9TELE
LYELIGTIRLLLCLKTSLQFSNACVCMFSDCGLRQFSSRIVGGTNASEGEWPWQVSLQVKGQHMCGGSLISSQWVVSAEWRKWFLQHPTEEVARVQRIHLHHYYDDESHDYDLALLKLDRPASAVLAGHARPACLPPPTHQLEPGLLCWVTGWGALQEGGENWSLRQLDICSIKTLNASFATNGLDQ